MSRVVQLSILVCLVVATVAHAAESGVFLNSFGETATAHLNDSFLLLGTVADGFVANTLSEKTAIEIGKSVQTRARRIRARLKAVSQERISDVDRQLVGVLDQAYACVEKQAGVLVRYANEKSPDAAKRFDACRVDCLNRLKKIVECYSTLPPATELPESLNTR